jgi:N-acetyl-beta-hexosaminidase
VAALHAAGAPEHLSSYFNQAAKFELEVPWQPAKNAHIRVISERDIAGHTHAVAEFDCP